MVQVVVRAIVVHDAAVDLAARAVPPEPDTATAGVMNDQINQAAARRLEVNSHSPVARGRRIHDLQAPQPSVRRIKHDVAVDRRALAGVLPDDDGTARRAGELIGEFAPVGAAPDPNGIARLHLSSTAGQSGGEVPGAVRAPVAACRSAGRHVETHVRPRRLDDDRRSPVLGFACRSDGHRSRRLGSHESAARHRSDGRVAARPRDRTASQRVARRVLRDC